jgi:hypothetical protein
MKTCRKGLHQFTGVQCHECWRISLFARRAAERLRHPERRKFTDEHRQKISSAKMGLKRGTRGPLKKRVHVPRNTFENNLRKYKLSVQDFATTWLRADGKCENPGCRRALDLDNGTWAIDHDHSCCPSTRTCGKCIRGLLCPQCNVATGFLGDSVSKALGLVEYLHRSTATQSPR